MLELGLTRLDVAACCVSASNLQDGVGVLAQECKESRAGAGDGGVPRGFIGSLRVNLHK